MTRLYREYKGQADTAGHDRTQRWCLSSCQSAAILTAPTPPFPAQVCQHHWTGNVHSSVEYKGCGRSVAVQLLICPTAKTLRLVSVCVSTSPHFSPVSHNEILGTTTACDSMQSQTEGHRCRFSCRSANPYATSTHCS